MAGSHTLVCNGCGQRYPVGSGYHLRCCDDGLLTAEYPRSFEVDPDRAGLWRFHRWLPVEGVGSAQVGSICCPAPELGARLGLDDLWVSFNGYWPERGGGCPTGSFKDLEVAPTLQRLVECGAPGVVVATAGNTGRAFAHLGGLVEYPVLVLVAEQHADRIWRPGHAQAPTTTVVALKDADYGDATAIAGEVADRLDWQLEGGVANVARRDGIGTLLLDAVVEMGRLPDHYVQAVGGGPGPIGVGEMADRLLAAGGYGERLPRFHLVQNVEHQPVNRAWRAGRARLQPDDFPPHAVETYADVLVNRRPAYDVRGGLFDLLTRTSGQTYAVDADAAIAAKGEFEAVVGIDVLEPAAVAVAGLARAVEEGEVARGDRVLLAVTGGGVERMAGDMPLHQPERIHRFALSEASAAIVDQVTAA